MPAPQAPATIKILLQSSQIFFEILFRPALLKRAALTYPFFYEGGRIISPILFHYTYMVTLVLAL